MRFEDLPLILHEQLELVDRHRYGDANDYFAHLRARRARRSIVNQQKFALARRRRRVD